MDMQKWFVLSDGQVRGPFEKADLEIRLSTFNNPLIWGRGQNEWLPPSKWTRLLSESTSSQTKVERLWRLRVGQQEMKPMPYGDMLEFLKTQKDLGQIQIWTEGYEEWKDLFELHRVMDDLGVSRRAHPRVPIMGTLTCEGSTGPFTARLLSISEGGLGVMDAPASQVRIGEKFKALLKSPNLFSPIHATVEVVYIGQDGYAGLKFAGLQMESKSSIIEYVRKFSESKN